MRPFTLLSFLALTCALVATNASAQSTFGPPIPIGPNISSVNTPFFGDIDGDGQKEVILGSTTFGEVIALDLAADSVTQLRRIIPEDLISNVMHVADVNNDGFPDLIRSRIADGSSNSGLCLAIYLGLGNGQFTSPIVTAWGTNYYSVYTADLTGDGRSEIIAVGLALDIYSFDIDLEQLVLFRSIPLPQGSQGFLTTDVTGDGIEDLVIAAGQGTGQLVAWDATTGANAPLLILDTNFGYIGKLLSADLNGDGRMDLFASRVSMNFYAWICTGGSNFTRSASMPLGPSFNSISALGPIVDLDEDGTPELLHFNENTLIRSSIFPDLSIAPPDTLAVIPEGISTFQIDDLDGDDAADIVIITPNARLLVAHGTASPGIFNEPVALFMWNNLSNHSLVAVDPDMNGRHQIAMISSNIVSDLVLFNEDIADALPRLKRSPMHGGQPAMLHSSSMQAYDFDGDGDDDLIGFQSHIDPFDGCDLFCMEDSSGTYVQRCLGQAIAFLNGVYNLSSMTALDVNGDGLADLICQGYTYDQQDPYNETAQDHMLLQTAPFEFELGTVPLPISYYSNHHDLDGDGLDELLVQTTSNALTIYHNEGGGTFTPLAPIATDGPIGTLWADADGDGIEDAIAFNYFANSAEVVYRTVALGSVSAKTTMFTYPVTNGILSYAIPADLDQNGHMDMLYISGSWAAHYELSAFMNLGAYPLTVGEVVDTNSAPSVFVMDMDGDGDLDIVTHKTSSFFLYTNEGILTSVREGQALVSGSIQIYPNPATDAVQVDLGPHSKKAQLVIRDLSGRTVLRLPATSATTSMDVRGLAQGIYVLQAIDGSTEAVTGAGRFMVAREQ